MLHVCIPWAHFFASLTRYPRYPRYPDYSRYSGYARHLIAPTLIFAGLHHTKCVVRLVVLSSLAKTELTPIVKFKVRLDAASVASVGSDGSDESHGRLVKRGRDDVDGDGKGHQICLEIDFECPLWQSMLSGQDVCTSLTQDSRPLGRL